MPTARPHGGLGLDNYVQATSPIQRYLDLAFHYQLKAHLRGEVLPFLALDYAADADRMQRVEAVVVVVVRVRYSVCWC